MPAQLIIEIEEKAGTVLVNIRTPFCEVTRPEMVMVETLRLGLKTALELAEEQGSKAAIVTDWVKAVAVPNDPARS